RSVLQCSRVLPRRNVLLPTRFRKAAIDFPVDILIANNADVSAAQSAEDIRTLRRLARQGPGHELLSDGTRIKTHTVIWAGGLNAAPLSANLGVQTGRCGRIDVQSDLTVKGFEAVYALGDFANIAGVNGNVLPQLASVAEQCGKWCAKNIALEAA